MSAPPSLGRLVEELERLPGIGRRSAERLAGHLLRVSESRALALADAIRDARTRIRSCSSCRAPTESDPCPICGDPDRDPTLLVVVETARDLAAFDASGGYRGLYFVLGGRLSPLDGIVARDLDLDRLRERVADGRVREVCIATNPDLEGDGTARLVERALAARGDSAAEVDSGAAGETPALRVTRLARGLPSGGQIEYQSATVLAEAFEERRALEGVQPTADPSAERAEEPHD